MSGELSHLVQLMQRVELRLLTEMAELLLILMAVKVLLNQLGLQQ